MAAKTTDSAGNGTAAAPVSDPTTAAAVASETPAAVETEPSSPPSSEDPAAVAAAPATEEDEDGERKKWPGWPGDSVFRMIVPVMKVGSIIGRKGEIIKKMSEESGASIRVLYGAIGTPERIILVSGREEPEAEISPAMDAVLRVFKRINSIPDSDGDGTTTSSTGPAVCSAQLLVASSQAINLIGKQGTSIKSIQESTGATVRVLSGDELPFFAAADERIVEIQGESLKVLNALEAVVGHLRKFLVHHSVIPLFEKNLKTPVAQDRPVDAWGDRTQSLVHTTQPTGVGSDYPPSLKRDSLFLDREAQLDSQIQRSGVSLYGQDPALSGLRSTVLGRTSGALVTQITQTMQIPLSYAEDIIGIGGGNIAYIRRTSGAVLTVQESRGFADEIAVEIKGTSTQVQTAQQLIQEFIAGHKEPVTSSYGSFDTGLRSSYSQLANSAYPSSNSAYPSSSLPSQTYGGYGSSGLGGYGSYRL